MNRFRYGQAAVTQAIKFIKSNKGSAPSFVVKFPGAFTVRKGKLYADGKQVVPTESRDDFLREVVYGKKSEYPFGRDSLFAILKHEVMNVSKRDIEAFLNAQGPIVHRRARPKKEKRERMRSIKKIGILSMDLAHIRAKDFEELFRAEPEDGLDYMGAPGSKGYQQDRYFLNAVDLLTGYLFTEILQGKTPKEVAPKVAAILDRFEKTTNTRVRQVEVDKGGEFMGVVSRMFRKATKKEKDLAIKKKKPPPKDGPFADVRLVLKTQNATVEQVNAKMQRIFWNLVAQKRGPFMTTVKQTVKISNRTQNRRTGLNPEQAMKNVVGGIKVTQRTPKAGPTERKKALAKGTKVRALLKVRAKGDSLGYKAYKGAHYGAVYPISKVKFIGVWPRYKVDQKWVWGDELIRARPGDTKSERLVIKRSLVMPAPPRPPAPPGPGGAPPRRSKRLARKAKKPAAPAPAPVFYKGQEVWYRATGGEIDSNITKINTRAKTAEVGYTWDDGVYYLEKPVAFSKLRAQAIYEIGDKVKVHTGDMWRNGEVDDFKNNLYVVFWRQDNKRWKNSFRGSSLRPRS